jgi:hypothetical protein
MNTIRRSATSRVYPYYILRSNSGDQALSSCGCSARVTHRPITESYCQIISELHRTIA